MNLIVTTVVLVAIVGMSEVYSETCPVSKNVYPDSCITIGPLCNNQFIGVAGRVCGRASRSTVTIESVDGILIVFDDRMNWGSRGKIIIGSSKLAGKSWENEVTFNFTGTPWVANGRFTPSFLIKDGYIRVGNAYRLLIDGKMKIPDGFDLSKTFKVCLKNCVGNFFHLVLRA